MRPTSSTAVAAALVAVALASFPAGAAASEDSWWSATPLTAVNLDGYSDGCPFSSDDGRRLYIASNRTGPGAQGGIDIWVSERPNKHSPWGTPVNLGPPVNSPANDFCPSPGRRGQFMFVSNRDQGCGGADIYVTHFDKRLGWAQPRNLGCDINSPVDEFGPVRRGHELYFSSNKSGNQEIYRSLVFGLWIGAPQLVTELSLDTAEDARPFVSVDGLEIVFDSTRQGGPPDIWSSTRRNVFAPWSTPVNLGGAVNTPAPETRASLSPDRSTLYFGRFAGPQQDVYTSTRKR
jgi:Tol biopolymer transport system component